MLPKTFSVTRAKFAPSASATVPATPTTTRRGETGARPPVVGERGGADGVPDDDDDDVESSSMSSDAPLARVARRASSRERANGDDDRVETSVARASVTDAIPRRRIADAIRDSSHTPWRSPARASRPARSSLDPVPRAS